MKQYAKLVEAIQYQGDIGEVQEFIGEGNFITIEGPSETDSVVINISNDKWRVFSGDYIVKDFKEIKVYKPARFEAEFDEVNVEDAVYERTDKAKSDDSISAEDLQKLENAVGAYPSSSQDNLKEVEAQNTIAPKSKKFPPKE